jgi:hypothetical protein
MSKAVLDGLKPQECKQGSSRVKPPILYIPEKDELQEAVENTASTKLTLPTKVELLQSFGTLEKFIMHIQQAISAIKAKGIHETTRSLFRPRRDAWRNSRRWYSTMILQKDKSLPQPGCMNSHQESSKGKSVVKHITRQISGITPTLFQKRQGSPETRSWPIRSTPVCGKT